MSATNRGAERHKDDDYATPAWAVRAILPHVPIGGDVLDPCAGKGALLAVLRDAGANVRGLELNPGRAQECRDLGIDCVATDALILPSWNKPTLILTNPPYSHALDFVTVARNETRQTGGTVAMLLRLNWMASQERAPIHRAAPSDIYVLDRRPSFTGDGHSDATEYGWFVWGPGRGGKWFVLDCEKPVRKVAAPKPEPKPRAPRAKKGAAHV